MSLSESWASSGGGVNIDVDLRTGTAQSIQAKLAADEARKRVKRIIAMSGVSQDAYGRWFWWTIDDVGFYEKRAVASSYPRPGFDRWRFAWTRAKHLRRAAEKWQVLQVAVHLSAYDTDVNDTGEYLTVLRRSTGAREMRDAYREAAERADWGTRT